MNYDKVTKVDGTECYIVPKDAFLEMLDERENLKIEVNGLQDAMTHKDMELSHLNEKVDELIGILPEGMAHKHVAAKRIPVHEKYVSRINELQLDLREATDALCRINHITEGWRPGDPEELKYEATDEI